MSEFSHGSHDFAPVPVSDDTEEEMDPEKAIAWLRAILRQPDAKMITTESLQRALSSVPEAEAADILQHKATVLVANLYTFESGIEQVKHSEDAVAVYFAFVGASSGMTEHEFRAVKYLHHELVHHFSQLPMLKPRNAGDELTISYLQNCKRKFDAAQNEFAAANEIMTANKALDWEEDLKVRLLSGTDEIREVKATGELGREQDEEVKVEVESLKKSLETVFYDTELDNKMVNPAGLIKDLHDLGQHKEVVEIISGVNVYLRAFLALPLEEQNYRDVRYFYNLMLKNLITLSAIDKVLNPAEEEVANSLKVIIEEKTLEVENLVAQFAADKGIQLEDKVDKCRDDLEGCLFEPSRDSFKVFKSAIVELYDMQRDDVVRELLQDQIDEAKELFYETSSSERLQKWLQKADIRLELLDNLEDVEAFKEVELSTELRRCWILKINNTKKIIEQIREKEENENRDAILLKESHGLLLDKLKGHVERLEKKNEEESEVEKLIGRLHLYLAQIDIFGEGDAVKLGKTIAALNKLGKEEMVKAVLLSVQRKNKYAEDKSRSQVDALLSLSDQTALTLDQLDQVSLWDEEIKEAEEQKRQRAAKWEEMRQKEERENNKEITPTVKLVKPVEKKEIEMSEEEQLEIVSAQLSFGSFGYAEQLLLKWWPENKRWFTNPMLKQAAQKGIEKQWKEKPLMRPILEKFIKKFELQTPVEPKPVKKSRKT